MEHVAIDLGGRKSQICVRGSDGSVIQETRLDTLELKEYLATRPRSRVVVETCAEAFRVADAALALGHEARVVPASLVRTLGVGARRTKTDRRDAQTLSEVSCRIDLPSVHIPSSTSRARKAESGMREVLLNSRTMVINSVRGWLRGQARRVPAGRAETFSTRVRSVLGSEIPSYVERQLRILEVLDTEIEAADESMGVLAEADDACRRLMSVPGIGPVTAVRFVAALDQVGRFSSAHQVESYLGLVPGESSSSERQHRLGITKAGPSALRRTSCRRRGRCGVAARSHLQYRCSYGPTGSSCAEGSKSQR